MQSHCSPVAGARATMCCTDKIFQVATLVGVLICISLLAGLYGYIDTTSSLEDNPGFAVLDELATFVNTAHYPLPYEEFSRPDQGACCHALCSGDTCFAGTAYTLDSRSCNLCCFHLVEPNSCDGHECACYANDQQ